MKFRGRAGVADGTKGEDSKFRPYASPLLQFFQLHNPFWVQGAALKKSSLGSVQIQSQRGFELEYKNSSTPRPEILVP